MLVYFPVWIDRFGGSKATTWITLLQIGVPLGIFAGYGMTSIIVQHAVVIDQIYSVAMVVLHSDWDDSYLYCRIFSAQSNETRREGSRRP